MTLQVGLVGSDGVVLASDRLLNQLEAGTFSKTRTSKFLSGDDMICCWSGDVVAEYAASRIADYFDKSETDRRRALVKCGDYAWQETCGSEGTYLANVGVGRKVLIGFQDGTLWETEIFQRSTARQVLDKVVAGDYKTTVKHLINNYVPDFQLPVSQLIRIATYAIRIGNRENNGGIGGLEVAIIKPGQKATFLPTKQEKELEQSSDELHDEIQRLLLQDYRPEGVEE